MGDGSEVDQIKIRYERRKNLNFNYSILNPAVYLTVQERERALIRLVNRRIGTIADKTVLEIGCGGGGNLLQ